MNIKDICYAYFGSLGRALNSLFKNIEHDLDSANMKIHPEVYFSLVSVASLISLIIPISIFMLTYLRIIPIDLPIEGIMYVPFFAAIPVIILVLGVVIPKMSASNRGSGLKIEIPYASMYISTMTSGGLSPFESILRIRKMDLLPNMQEEVTRIQTIVVSQGVDPISAMEQAAKVVEMKDYKELLLGYASSVRTGGDTLHYLFNQTDSMFKSLSTKIKGMGESMGMLMEAYTIIAILGVLGLFLIFVVGMAMPSFSAGLTEDQFMLFSYVVMPMMSFLFIFAGDMAQISYPVSNWKVYIVFLLSLPIAAFLGSQTVMPYFDTNYLIFPIFQTIMTEIRLFLGMAEGTEAVLGLSITLILTTLPGWLADKYFVGREAQILDGINSFLRDLVETRKSGLGPERCIQALSERDYGMFSSHLQRINMKLNWGYPLRLIYDDFRMRVKNWLALINIYLLVDTLEVGGGTEESLETLAKFAESTKLLEDEKKAVLMPLTVVPLIGAALLTGTTVMFLQFFTSGMTGMGGVSVASVALNKMLLTPLALHSWTLGLVTGKIVAGRVSAGFKYSIVFTIISVAGILLVGGA